MFPLNSGVVSPTSYKSVPLGCRRVIILELNILKIEPLISTLSKLLLLTVPNSVNGTIIFPVAQVQNRGFIPDFSFPKLPISNTLIMPL